MAGLCALAAIALQKAWTGKTGARKGIRLQPLLEHSTFLQSLLGSPPPAMNSWCSLQSCFISFRSDELQRRSVATAPHSLEAAGINFKHPVLTSRLALKINWLIYRLSKQTGRPWVNCLGQAPQKQKAGSAWKASSTNGEMRVIIQVGIAPHSRPWESEQCCSLKAL